MAEGRLRQPWLAALLGSICLAASAWGLPGWAASALAAWRITADGLLELRTSPYANLSASFDPGDGVQGARLWIDLPGTPSRPRTLQAGGPLRQVRVGTPEAGVTRLVLEFQPGVQLDPAQLKLMGVDKDSWKLQLPPQLGRYLALGEGSLVRPDPVLASPSEGFGAPSGPAAPRQPLRPLRPADLPSIARGRFRVVIDPGHGGPDPGAIGIGSTQEKDVVLEISQQVAELLRGRGVDVLLTRTGDIDVDLPPRAQLANGSGADVFVSIHANALSMSRPDVNGLETFYFQSQQGRSLAAAIHNSIMGTVRREDRGVREGRFYVIRATRMPSSLVEVGFLTGADDAPDLMDPAHRRQLALAISAGILDYLRLAG